MTNAADVSLAGDPPRTRLFQQAEELFTAGQLSEARPLFESCAAHGPSPATSSIRLAAIAALEGRVGDSVAWLSRALEIDPANAESHYAQGRNRKTLREFAAAETSYREAVHLRPDYVEAWISLGVLLQSLHRSIESEKCLRTAIALEPGSSVAVLNLGNALFSQRRYEEAAECSRRVLGLDPQSAKAHNNLARALFVMRDAQGAVDHYCEALRLDPRYFDAADGLGALYFGVGEFEAALTPLTIACDLRPESAMTRDVLARCYLCLHRFEEAKLQYERLLRDQPGMPRALGGLAHTLASRGEYTKPRALFEAAVANTDDPWVRYCYAEFLLRAGDFVQGWPNYESRWFVDSHTVLRKLPQPRWQGEALASKSLLILCEQGLGDEIMFASTFAEAIGEARHCTIECDIRLERLFQRSFPTATIFGVKRKNEPRWFHTLERELHRLPSVDCWTPAGSLPVHKRRALEDYPRHSGYLLPNAERVRDWTARLGEFGTEPKIGISWRGGTARTETGSRSLGLDELSPLLGDNRIHWVSLQYGDCEAEIDDFTARTGVRIHHWQNAIDDYDETAALLCSLDLVISVCTSVVHLGGALGRPVWVMAPYAPGWRYGREGPSMVWYPSVRMVRQSKSRSWTPVLAEVRRSLNKVLAGTSPYAAV